MYATSENYNPYPLVRRVQPEITFRILDETAAGSATCTASPAAPPSNIGSVVTADRRSFGTVYATMEQDYLECDKAFTLMPDDYSFGFWSEEISDADGEFENPLTFTATFDHAISSLGFTIDFDRDGGQWAKRVTIQVYSDDDALIESKDFAVDGAALLAYMPTDNYSKVVFSFGGTNHPFRRLRLAAIHFGFVEEYKGNRLRKMSMESELSITAESLASTKLKFEINNTDREYQITNPSMIYRFISSGQRIQTQIDIDGEIIPMQEVRFSSAEANEGGRTATIVGYDDVLKLDEVSYEASGSGTWTAGEAMDAIIAYLATENISMEYTMPDTVRERTLQKPEDEEYKVRQYICYIAQAALSLVYMCRDGRIAFVDAEESPVDTLNASNCTALAKVKDEGRINTVQLKNGRKTSSGKDSPFTARATMRDGEPKSIETFTNLLVPDERGQEVADWLLAQCEKRLQFKPSYRGNPAIDLGDMVQITDPYGQTNTVRITGTTIEFDGYLRGTITARGEMSDG